MEKDIFGDSTGGQIALKKLAPVPDSFRLYAAGWLGGNPKDWDTMEFTGCEFRLAKSGPNKGKLCIPIKGTRRTAYVTRSEVQSFETAAK